MLGDYIKGGAILRLLAGLLILSDRSSSSDTTSRRTYPLPFFHDLAFDVSDVIMRPLRGTLLSVNATLFDLDTNTTICDLSSTRETEFRVQDGDSDCTRGDINKGYTLITSADVSLQVRLSGNPSPLPSVYAMGERYIFPGDFDKHRPDRTKSLLIYPSVKNTTARVCFDRFDSFDRHDDQYGDHFSAKFMPRLQNWVDGTLTCYQADLARDEIWVINNVSGPAGLEVRADNPVGVLRVPLGNPSHDLEDGQVTEDPESRISPIFWGIYPPLKFWGKEFILFPRKGIDQLSVIVVAENETVLTVNTSGVITTFTIKGWKAEQVPLSFGNHVTLVGTSRFVVYTVTCARNQTREPETTYSVAIDSSVRNNSTRKGNDLGIHVVCSDPMDAWAFHGTNTTKINPEFAGLTYVSDRRIYFASFPTAGEEIVTHVNVTWDRCFLQTSLNTGQFCAEANITATANNIIKSTSKPVKSDKTHHMIVSESDLSDSSSGGVIGVGIYHNVNKSGARNLSDVGLNGNKTGNTGNGSDEQIASNHARDSYVPTKAKPQELITTLLHFTKTSADNATDQSGTSTMASTLSKDVTRNQTFTTSSMESMNVPNVTEGYRITASSGLNRTSIQISAYVKNSGSGNRAETVGNDAPNRGDKEHHNKSHDSTDSLVNGPTIPTENHAATTLEHNITSGLEVLGPKATSGFDENVTEPIRKFHNNTEVVIDRKNQNSGYYSSKRVSGVAKSAPSKTKVISNATIPNTNISNTNNSNATFSDANISNTNTSNTNISNSNISDANISDTFISKDVFRNDSKHSKTVGASSNDTNGRFKVVVDILSAGKKNTDLQTRLLRYESKNPTYIHQGDDRGSLEQIEDGKSLVAVIVSLSSAVLAVIAIILVFFFIEFFSRRKQHRTTRIRPFLSEF